MLMYFPLLSHFSRVHRVVSILSVSTICTYVNGNEAQTVDVVREAIPLYLCITLDFSADYCHSPHDNTITYVL